MGTAVSLVATPGNASSFFGGWGGDCSGTGACVLAMTGPHTVTASFNSAPPPPAPSCSLTANPPSFTLGTATNVALTALCSGSPTSYAWISPSGAPLVPGGTGSSYNAVFPASTTAGTYTYSVVATNLGGQSPAAIAPVTVSATPPPPITPSACGTNVGAVSTVLSSGSPNLCASGNVVSAFGGLGTSAAPWTWLCTGTNNSSPASCSAAMIVPTTTPGIPAGCTLKDKAVLFPDWVSGSSPNAAGVPFITQSVGAFYAFKFNLNDLISPARQASSQPWGYLHFYQGPDVNIEISNKPCDTSTTPTVDACRMRFVNWGDKYYLGPNWSGALPTSSCKLPAPDASNSYYFNVKVNTVAPGYNLMYESGL